MKLYTVGSLRVRACALAFALVIPAVAQQPSPVTSLVATPPSPFRLLAPKLPGCKLEASDLNSFRDRACYQAERMLSPASLLHGIAESGFSQLRNSPYTRHEQAGDFGRRLEFFYARKGARASGELIAGWLNHEPVRPSASSETGFWNRSRAAMLSVLVVRDGSNWRPALAPMAGSLASGFVTLGCCGMHSSTTNALDRSGATYAGYFAAALFREFKPELKAFALRKLHR